MSRRSEQQLDYIEESHCWSKRSKPTNDKPNINGIDFHINLKKFIRQIKEERLQFVKTFEGTYLEIQYSIINFLFVGELDFNTFIYIVRFLKRNIQHVHILHKVSHTWTQNKGKRRKHPTGESQWLCHENLSPSCHCQFYAHVTLYSNKI
jgi:hypothetical protein